MLFKVAKKKTNGCRHKLIIQKKNLVKFKPLLISIKKKPNRSYNQYRYNNKALNLLLQPGTVVGRDKDNFRSNFLVLIRFKSGAYSYFASSYGLKINQQINFQFFKNSNLLEIGQITILKYLRPGMQLHNLTSFYTKLATYSRAAGTYATLLMHFSKDIVYIKLPSLQIKKLPSESRAIVGRADNIIHKFENYGKAGYKKYFGLKPVVRGVAQNAVDHPHGGRTKGGIPKHSPWGWIIK